MLRRQLAERQQLEAAQGGAAAAGESPRREPRGDAQHDGGRQRVLGLDGAWVEQTWVMVRPSISVWTHISLSTERLVPLGRVTVWHMLPDVLPP